MSIIVMTDDDFEKNMQRLADQFHPLLAASFRARDTAQREALAQLQAEMPDLRANMTKALDLLQVLTSTKYTDRAFVEAVDEADEMLEQLRGKVVLKGQAEQQEAQGAQAGDERAAFLVVGVVDYESTEALAAFLDRSQAESWLAEIEAYQERHPGWWSHDASEQEQDAACEKLESWRKGHPAGVSASSCDSFHVMEIPLRAALATQPADSIAVNRLRLSLVAWDAELAEQDYQLTSDDLREKLRQIHRDIDRLMPEQGQAAVRGAEHE